MHEKLTKLGYDEFGDDVSINIEESSNILVVGESGSGKTTILNNLLIGALRKPGWLPLMLDYSPYTKVNEFSQLQEKCEFPYERFNTSSNNIRFCVQEIERRRETSEKNSTPILLLVDNFHNFNSHDDKKVEQAFKDLHMIATEGPSFNIYLVIATKSKHYSHKESIRKLFSVFSTKIVSGADLPDSDIFSITSNIPKLSTEGRNPASYLVERNLIFSNVKSLRYPHNKIEQLNLQNVKNNPFTRQIEKEEGFKIGESGLCVPVHVSLEKSKSILVTGFTVPENTTLVNNLILGAIETQDNLDTTFVDLTVFPDTRRLRFFESYGVNVGGRSNFKDIVDSLYNKLHDRLENGVSEQENTILLAIDFIDALDRYSNFSEKELTSLLRKLKVILTDGPTAKIHTIVTSRGWTDRDDLINLLSLAHTKIACGFESKMVKQPLAFTTIYKNYKIPEKVERGQNVLFYNNKILLFKDLEKEIRY